MTKINESEDLFLRYIAEYPNHPNKTLARLILEENPGIGTLEAVRGCIRARKGAKGVRERAQRSRVAGREIDFRSTIEEGLRKYKIISRDYSKPDVVLPAGRYLALSDIHIPIHDEQAVVAALEHGYKRGVGGIVLNGDILDCYQISSFTHEYPRPPLEEEIDMGRGFLAMLRETWDCPIFWKLGNHEKRLRRTILSKPELAGLRGLEFHEQLDFEHFRVRRVDDEKIKAGKLNVLHGHEFGGSFYSPVNPARGLYLRAKANAIQGHLHVTSEHSEGNLNEKDVACWSTGCLCLLNPEYRPYAYTKWNHGAAIVEVFDEVNFEVDNFRIIRGKVR